jgi:hypothetical protein
MCEQKEGGRNRDKFNVWHANTILYN